MKKTFGLLVLIGSLCFVRAGDFVSVDSSRGSGRQGIVWEVRACADTRSAHTSGNVVVSCELARKDNAILGHLRSKSFYCSLEGLRFESIKFSDIAYIFLYVDSGLQPIDAPLDHSFNPATTVRLSWLGATIESIDSPHERSIFLLTSSMWKFGIVVVPKIGKAPQQNRSSFGFVHRAILSEDCIAEFNGVVFEDVGSALTAAVDAFEFVRTGWRPIFPAHSNRLIGFGVLLGVPSGNQSHGLILYGYAHTVKGNA